MDFNIPLSNIDKTIRQKNEQGHRTQQDLNQQDPAKTHRALHMKTADYKSFLSPHRAYSNINHILSHETNLSKFKAIGIIQSVFSDDNEVKLESNNRKLTGKCPNTWKL